MAAPKGSQLSKAEFERAKALIEQIISDAVVSADTATLAQTLTAIDAEIAAR